MLRKLASRQIIRIRDIPVVIELATDAKTLEQGLSGRTSLGENCGMLFVFPYKGLHGFHMRNCFFPIDIAFIDGNRIVDIQSMLPHPEQTWLPAHECDKALEVNQGFFDNHGIQCEDLITDLID